MAPSKRRRTSDDDGESERAAESDVSNDDNSSRTAVHRENNKRSRLALAAENGGSVVSDHSDHENDGEADETRERNGDGETEQEDKIVQDMQRTFDRRSFNDTRKQNQPAEYGVVEEVYCQNFMCHEKLRIKLGPLINFIIGHNGSGKSAVLTALTLCLGVKATATNRGASLKNFIKEGQENAMLSVKIKNQGDSAYQRDVYGDSIIVERHFSRAGSTSFKIKNADGRVVTTKRSELEDMLDFLGLQLDNPLNVLSQDLARQFLSSSTPKDKYKFFMRGTQLEQLDRDYSLMFDYIDQTEAKLLDRKEDIDVLKRNMEAAEQKKKLMDQANTIRSRIAQLQWMHAWAQVEVVERELTDAEKNIVKAERDVEVKKADADAKRTIYEGKNADWEAAKAVRAEAAEQLRPAVEQRESVKAEDEKIRAQLIEHSTQRRHIQTDLGSAQKDVDKCKELIAQEQARVENASGPAQAAKLQELEESRADVEAKRADLDKLDRRSLDKDNADALANSLKKRDIMNAASEVLEERRQQLQVARGSANNEMRGFHPSMPSLLKTIASDTRFKEKPIGPLGLYVKLRPEWKDWASIIETIFGLTLESFIVTNGHDQSILRQILSRNHMHFDIYIGDSRPLDISQHDPQPKLVNNTYDTLLNVLVIDHPAIRNLFIINQSAEQTVLIQNRRDGLKFMFDQNNTSRSRQHVKNVVCMHDSIRNEGVRLARTANGQKSDRIREWTKNLRMKTNIEEEIRFKQAAVENATKDYDAKKQDHRASEMRLKATKEAITRYENSVKAAKITWQKAVDHVEDLKSQLEQLTVDAGTLDSLREQLAEAQGSKEQHERTYEDATVARDRVVTLQAAVTARLVAATKETTELETRLTKFDASVAKHQIACQNAERERNQARGFVAIAETTREEAIAAKQVLEVRVQEFASEAAQIHARVPVEAGTTADAIDKRLDKLTAEQQTVEQRAGGTREEVIQAWAKAREDYRSAEKELSSLESVNALLKRSLGTRKEKWRQFRRFITARAKFMFAMLLHERGFDGKIIIDHEGRQLDIKVEPDSTQQSDKGRQAKTLSGGEKSFSTICLLLAIWEAMGSPIRCLDEFDVFMDNVNRDISMRMMIQAARRATGKQYVLITPQAMGNVAIDSDVKIHKMSDPERGQTSLPY